MTSAPLTHGINEALPEEVLGVIFEEHAKLEWNAPVIDGQVCRQWQQTILRSPRAWAHLEIVEKFRSAPSKLHQWLDRSGSVPLHITTNCTPGEEEAVDQHHKRVESISTCWCSPTIALFGNQSFPILQSLSIRGWRPGKSWLRCNAWRAIPELRSFRASKISFDDLPSNAFPQLRVLALYLVHDCGYIIKNLCHSLTSLMLHDVSLKHTSESLEFPSLRFLSLFAVGGIKHRMNVPALTTYHESERLENESFPMPIPTLVEYGIYGLKKESPFNIMKLHQCYPNISHLSVRGSPSDVKRFILSLCGQPTALPMLRILAVDRVHSSNSCSGDDEHSMKHNVFVRNMARSVKMELCFNGMIRVPLYFGKVRVYINEGRSELTSILRTRMSPIEDLSFVHDLWPSCYSYG
jgi:hypothetical protein